jgi:CSLREA domain-containing protein
VANRFEKGSLPMVNRKPPARRKHCPASLRGRRLGFEPLESRRLLTLYVVDSLEDDEVADGLITLREAIGAANGDCQVGDVGPDSGANVVQLVRTDVQSRLFLRIFLFVLLWIGIGNTVSGSSTQKAVSIP